MHSYVSLLFFFTLLTAALVQAKVGDAYASILYVRQADENLQAFNQSLADAAAPPIVPSGQTDRPFMVNGNTFVCSMGLLSLMMKLV